MSLVLTERELVDTYEGYDEPWEIVQQYQRVIEYKADHPDLGSSAISSRLNLPRSRIRTWVDDDGMPDAVRGLSTAQNWGWIPLSYDDQIFRGMNILVAWIFSAGSINVHNYVPLFAVGNDDEFQHLHNALLTANIEYQTLREEETNRATEVKPRSASVVGRILVALGAPVGEKNEQTEISLPDYLENAPKQIKYDFAETYLRNRGQRYEDKRILTLREVRSDKYLNELADFLCELSSERVNVSDKNLILSANAAQALYSRFENH